jgi:hypothetical protein
MRISVDPNCRDYRPDAHKFDVYLDGVKLEDCITADDSRGKVTVYARGEDGKLISDSYGIIKRSVLSGVVTFDPHPAPARSSPSCGHDDSAASRSPAFAPVNPHYTRNPQGSVT